MHGPRVAVVGAGWSGAVVARELHDAGVSVEVFEREEAVGGHSRSATLNGVMYEPNGAHIFHTSNAKVAAFVQRFGMHRSYEHTVLAEVYLHPDDDEPTVLSWPPQVDELRELSVWSTIERELAQLPAAPVGEDFATYVMSMMGRTLYEMFIHGYTRKQWGRDPSELSKDFAPRRVELRRDGYRRLFRDRWEYFERDGVNRIIERVLSPVPVTTGAVITMKDADVMSSDFDAFVVTSPLDHFVDRDGELEWRGVRLVSRYVPVEHAAATLTTAYVVNRASSRVPFTRTIETKHASGQLIDATVVSEEHPGSPARHYPVPTLDRCNETLNADLKRQIADSLSRPVFYCGRLAEYVYINQDEAIARAMACAGDVLETLGHG